MNLLNLWEIAKSMLKLFNVTETLCNDTSAELLKSMIECKAFTISLWTVCTFELKHTENERMF